MREDTVQVAKGYTEWLIKTGGFARDLTIRDEFSVLAMQSIMTSKPNTDYVDVARNAYQMADAMLKERNK